MRAKMAYYKRLKIALAEVKKGRVESHPSVDDLMVAIEKSKEE